MMLRGAPVEETGGRSRRATEAILRSAERMNRLIGDLLDASSIEAGRLSIERSVHAVDALVFDALEAVEASAAQKALRLESNVVGDARVFCDRGRILQVFANLVGNAVKFTPRGGSISLQVSRGRRGLLLRVRHRPRHPGGPAPPHLRPVLAGQAHRTMGTGLGLSIARGILEAHGGQIGVDSQVGGGSTFFFTLPRADPV